MLEFWIRNETTGESLLLPVNPEGYELTFGMEIETVRATELGDINVPGRRKPRSITLESFFPDRAYPFARSSGSAMGNVQMLEKWTNNKDILRVVIADEKGARVNGQFHLEDVTYSQKQEDNGDIPFSLRFRQYTPMQVKPVTASPADSGKRADAATAAPAKKSSYTVKKGDCLYNIARQVYGDASKWKKIYEANKGVIGKNPNLIFPGQTYKIP